MEQIGRHSKLVRAAQLVLAAAALTCGGCLLAAAGIAGGAAAGVAYCNGKLNQVYNADFADAVAAVRTALGELGMPVEQEELDGGHGFIRSRIADGARVRVYLDTLPSKFPTEGPLTRVGVRVATFGDDLVSERILAQIGAHLVSTQVPGAPTPAQFAPAAAPQFTPVVPPTEAPLPQPRLLPPTPAPAPPAASTGPPPLAN